MIKWTDFGAGFIAGLASGSLLKKLFSGITNAIQGFYRTIIDNTRELFNSDVRSGKFVMTKQIQSDAEDFKKSKSRLNQWFSKYANDNAYRGIMIQGHLFYIQNYDPLTKDKLPFYDTKPLVLSFGIYLAQTGNLVQYGINLHMLPKEIREKFLIDIFELFRTKFNNEMYSKKPRKINEFSWQTLQSFVDKYSIDFAVRSYIPEKMHGTVYIDYKDWGKALVLAGNYVGTNEIQLRRMYIEHVKTKKLK